MEVLEVTDLQPGARAGVEPWPVQLLSETTKAKKRKNNEINNNNKRKKVMSKLRIRIYTQKNQLGEIWRVS